MPCTCRARLRHAADELLAEAEKARAPYDANLRARAMGYAAAAGWLARHDHDDEPEPEQP